MFLRWAVTLDCLGGPQYNRKDPYKTEAREVREKKKKKKTEARRPEQEKVM